MKTREKLALAAIVILAALLRFGGISHDLYEGYIYHPDAPKQIHAVQMFLSGHYYWHVGNKDYDGYPLLHAHLLEYFIRIAEPMREKTCSFIGIPPSETKPLDDTMSLYWLLLSMNALMSTGIVLIVFRIGREAFSPAVGWIAAALMAVSPVDIVSSHMATGDATTAYFATLAILYTLRVYRLGRYRDYALAAAMATFAFAAKYYAATAFFALALAHITRCGTTRPASWFSPDALRRIGLAAAVALVALFLAVPALFAHFRAELIDIWDAMMVSTQRYPESLRGSAKWQRIMFSMHVNMPDLLRAITPVACGAVILAIITRLRKDARIWILLIGVLLYVFLAVASRGLVNPVYHIAITPPVFLLTAFFFVGFWKTATGWRPARRPASGLASRVARFATVAAVGAMFCLLCKDAAREVFFPSHWDTRRLAQTWAKENVPATFPGNMGRYTFDWIGDDRPTAKLEGLLYASSALAPHEIDKHAIHLKCFQLEKSSLTQFRNIDEELCVFSPDLLRSGFAVPVSQRWPSQTGSPFILDNGTELLRSEKYFIIDPSQAISRWLVTDRPLEEVWVAAQTIGPSVKKTFRFADERRKLLSGGDTSAFTRIVKPRPQWPSGGGLFFYKIEVSSVNERTRFMLATGARDAGRMLANLGCNANAAPLLAQGALADKDPAAAAMAIVAARAAGVQFPPEQAAGLAALAKPVTTVTDDATFFAVFGIHPHYLDQLPFIRLDATNLEAVGFRPKAMPYCSEESKDRELVVTAIRKFWPERETCGLRTSPWTLDPGRYRVTLLARAPSGVPHGQTLHLTVNDAKEKTILQRELALPSFDAHPYTPVPFDIDVPPGCSACTISLHSELPPDLAIGAIEIRPDVVGNVIALGKAIDAGRP